MVTSAHNKDPSGIARFGFQDSVLGRILSQTEQDELSKAKRGYRTLHIDTFIIEPFRTLENSHRTLIELYNLEPQSPEPAGVGELSRDTSGVFGSVPSREV